MVGAKGISAWCIASFVLLLGWLVFVEYKLYSYDPTGRPWIWFPVFYQVGVVILLVGVVCGVIAIRRGSKGISAWGIVSLVLLFGCLGFGEYNLYLSDQTGRPWIWFTVYYHVCVVILLVAVVCGVIAMRRGSKWWVLAVAPALLFAVLCYFSDL